MNINECIKLDTEDNLKQFRKEFFIPDSTIYLNGNSLGLMSRAAEKSMMTILDSWKKYGIDGWTKGEYPWFYLTAQVSEMISPLLGADSENIVITGSTTSNIHQIVRTLYKPTKKRYKIIADTLNFPSDIYALSSILEERYDKEYLYKIPSKDQYTLDETRLIEAMDESVALILLPSVLYRSGQVLNMERLTKAAHAKGIIIGFDLCHSVGVIPHQLDKWDIDFAVWCTYKHLNGGPGSVGGLYVNQRHHNESPALAGWFGSKQSNQFDMSHTFTRAEDAKAYQMGTPHILSMAPLIGALNIFEEVSIEAVREKSLKLTDILIEGIEERLLKYGFLLKTPLNHHDRGGHVYIEHEEAASICQAMKDNNIIVDFRAPKGIRIAPVALYNTYIEMHDTVECIETIMKKKVYKKYKNECEIIS